MAFSRTGAGLCIYRLLVWSLLLLLLFTPKEIFTSVWADGFSLEFE